MIDLIVALALVVAAPPIQTHPQCPFPLDTATIYSDRNLSPFIASLRHDTFVRSIDQSAIQPFIMEELECVMKSRVDSMLNAPLFANPGEEFSGGCIIMDHIPRRGIVFLASSADMLVLMYDMGGIATTRHLILIRYRDTRIIDLWSGIYPHELQSSPTAIARYLGKNIHKRDRLHLPWM